MKDNYKFEINRTSVPVSSFLSLMFVFLFKVLMICFFANDCQFWCISGPNVKHRYLCFLPHQYWSCPVFYAHFVESWLGVTTGGFAAVPFITGSESGAKKSSGKLKKIKPYESQSLQWVPILGWEWSESEQERKKKEDD